MNQQPANYATLLIPGSNGQQQMIKVIGSTTKIPVQLATSSGSVPIKRVFKTGDQTTTFIQDGKVQGRPFIAIPTSHQKIVPGIRGPVMVPVNSVQIKTDKQQIGVPRNSTPVVICHQSDGTIQVPTKTINMAMPTKSLSIPSKSINLGSGQVNMAGGPVIQAHIKHISNDGTVLQPQVKQIAIPEASKETKKVIQREIPKIKQEIDTLSPPKSLMNTSILDHSGVRKRQDFEFDYNTENKRRKTEKGGKGLRHFSMKVCEKVKTKGTTSYNEVADELVNEFTESRAASPLAENVHYDQKNIRRRVYDALNVLMAMNIISKEKKEIRWLGLPTNSAQECTRLEEERKKINQRIELKTQQLQDLIVHQIAFKNLVERNRKRERETGSSIPPKDALHLPFILVNTEKSTTIDCSITPGKEEYQFNFDNTFEIHDDMEVLKRLGMALGLEKGECTPENVEYAKKLLPKALEEYVVDLASLAKRNSQNGVAQSKMCSLEIDEDSLDSTDFRQKIFSRQSSFSSITQLRSRSPSSYGDDSDSEIS